MAVFGLHCCMRLSSGKQRATLCCSVQASLVDGGQGLGLEDRLKSSEVAACGLSSCAARLSCSEECGIFPDQGLNLCPMHWRAGSYPLHHQRSPVLFFMMGLI